MRLTSRWPFFLPFLATSGLPGSLHRALAASAAMARPYRSTAPMENSKSSLSNSNRTPNLSGLAPRPLQRARRRPPAASCLSSPTLYLWPQARLCQFRKPQHSSIGAYGFSCATSLGWDTEVAPASWPKWGCLSSFCGLQQDRLGLFQVDVEPVVFERKRASGPGVFPVRARPRFRQGQRGVTRKVGIVPQSLFQIARQNAERSILGAPCGNVHRLQQIDLFSMQGGVLL